jgi:hypothetical protein
VIFEQLDNIAGELFDVLFCDDNLIPSVRVGHYRSQSAAIAIY